LKQENANLKKLRKHSIENFYQKSLEDFEKLLGEYDNEFEE
jgi:hypothetical protein